MELPETQTDRHMKAVDFFCSGGGMTSGFRKAGVKVLGGIDFDIACKATYEYNNPGVKFLHSDIKELGVEELARELKIRPGDDNMIFIGCSPCQYWSKIKTDKAKSQESKNLLEDFQRFVAHFRPGWIAVENVPGILNKLDESPLKAFLEFLTAAGYKYVYKVVNASHHGVPQTRRRFLLIASRTAETVTLPKGDKQNIPTVRQFIGNEETFPAIGAGNKDLTDYMHSTAALTEKNLRRLEMTPKDGGTRNAWANTDLQIPAYVGKDDSFQDVYGRMFWDKPGPTITTKFLSITNGRFAHPEQARGISLREGATLQTFDKSYKFIATSQAAVARIIGNAVPPELSKRIAEIILKH